MHLRTASHGSHSEQGVGSQVGARTGSAAHPGQNERPLDPQMRATPQTPSPLAGEGRERGHPPTSSSDEARPLGVAVNPSPGPSPQGGRTRHSHRLLCPQRSFSGLTEKTWRQQQPRERGEERSFVRLLCSLPREQNPHAMAGRSGTGTRPKQARSAICRPRRAGENTSRMSPNRTKSRPADAMDKLRDAVARLDRLRHPEDLSFTRDGTAIAASLQPATREAGESFQGRIWLFRPRRARADATDAWAERRRAAALVAE